MCLFLFSVFGILGINVFSGVLRFRCMEPLDMNGTEWIAVDGEQVWLAGYPNSCSAPEFQQA